MISYLSIWIMLLIVPDGIAVNVAFLYSKGLATTTNKVIVCCQIDLYDEDNSM